MPLDRQNEAAGKDACDESVASAAGGSTALSRRRLLQLAAAALLGRPADARADRSFKMRSATCERVNGVFKGCNLDQEKRLKLNQAAAKIIANVWSGFKALDYPDQKTAIRHLIRQILGDLDAKFDDVCGELLPYEKGQPVRYSLKSSQDGIAFESVISIEMWKHSHKGHETKKCQKREDAVYGHIKTAAQNCHEDEVSPKGKQISSAFTTSSQEFPDIYSLDPPRKPFNDTRPEMDPRMPWDPL